MTLPGITGALGFFGRMGAGASRDRVPPAGRPAVVSRQAAGTFSYAIRGFGAQSTCIVEMEGRLRSPDMGGAGAASYVPVSLTRWARCFRLVPFSQQKPKWSRAVPQRRECCSFKSMQ